MLERRFVFQYYLLSCRYVMLQNRILSKPKWGEGGHKQSLGGHGPRVATALQYCKRADKYRPEPKKRLLNLDQKNYSVIARIQSE